MRVYALIPERYDWCPVSGNDYRDGSHVHRVGDTCAPDTQADLWTHEAVPPTVSVHRMPLCTEVCI